MSQEEQAASTDQDVAEAPVAAEPESSETTPVTELSSGPLHGLIAALVAAFVTWGILHLSYPVFEIPEGLQNVQPTAPAELQAKQATAMQVAAMQNAVLAYGLFGLTLGVFAVGIDSLARGRYVGILVFGLLGGVIAGVAGCAAGWAGVVINEQLQQARQYSPLLRTIILQAACLGIIGIGLGIALAVPYRRGGLFVSCILGCVLGAMLAALVYPVAMSTLAPTAQTESLVPYVSWTRFAWLATVAALIALVATGLGKRKPKPTT